MAQALAAVDIPVVQLKRSFADTPFTMAIVFVSGKTCKIFSKAAAKSLRFATTASFSVSLSYWTRRA